MRADQNRQGDESLKLAQIELEKSKERQERLCRKSARSRQDYGMLIEASVDMTGNIKGYYGEAIEARIYMAGVI